LKDPVEVAELPFMLLFRSILFLRSR